MPDHPPSRSEFFVVLLGGLGLAAGAGFVNTVVLAMSAPPVTHLTGTISRLSADLGNQDIADAKLVAGLTMSFVTGAALSGVILGSSTLRLGRRYGVAVLLESILLACAALTISHSLIGGAMLAAAAAGLQNAMASSYRSLIIRTTHVTGVLTDIGFLAGQRIAGHAVEPWRIALLVMILVAFVTGGISGVLVHARYHENALWIPTFGLATGGAIYLAWNAHVRRKRRTSRSHRSEQQDHREDPS